MVDWTIALGMLFVLVVLFSIARYALSRDPVSKEQPCRPHLLKTVERQNETIYFYEGDADRDYLAELGHSVGHLVKDGRRFTLTVPKNPYLTRHQPERKTNGILAADNHRNDSVWHRSELVDRR